jgi:hypothetical protein
MDLSAREEVLIQAFRRLPSETAEELSALTERLAALGNGKNIDWSDSWSDADIREFAAASLWRVDEDERDNLGRLTETSSLPRCLAPSKRKSGRRL